MHVTASAPPVHGGTGSRSVSAGSCSIFTAPEGSYVTTRSYRADASEVVSTTSSTPPPVSSETVCAVAGTATIAEMSKPRTPLDRSMDGAG